MMLWVMIDGVSSFSRMILSFDGGAHFLIWTDAHELKTKHVFIGHMRLARSLGCYCDVTKTSSRQASVGPLFALPARPLGLFPFGVYSVFVLSH